MKILRTGPKGFDLKAWKIVKECKECESELELGYKDISYFSDYSPYSYGTSCVVCHNRILISEKEIPKLVRNDATTHRYIYSSGGGRD